LCNAHPFKFTKEFFDDLSEITYDGEGGVACPKHLNDFLTFFGNEEDFDEVEVNMLLAYTLCESPE